MNRRNFFSRMVRAIAGVVCAPLAFKSTVCFPRFISNGSRTGGTAFWTPNDGSFLVPKHLVPSLQKFLKDGGTIVGEEVAVNMKPTTLEQVAKARGVKLS